MGEPGDEVLDVVDETGQRVDQAPRREIHEEERLHLAVHVLLVDDDGQVLLQRRAASKRTYAGLWTSSASGHVPAGEPVEQAARREVREELGIDPPDLTHLGSTRVEDRAVGEREITHVFVARYDGPVDPDPDEVAQTRWLEIDRLDDLVQDAADELAGTFLPVYRYARTHADILEG